MSIPLPASESLQYCDVARVRNVAFAESIKTVCTGKMNIPPSQSLISIGHQQAAHPRFLLCSESKFPASHQLRKFHTQAVTDLGLHRVING